MIFAYHNHGRWVADCLTPYCKEAKLADDPRACQNCGRSYEVRYPADRVLIEAVLARRVVPETRTWIPGETVADLVAENEAHVGAVV